MNQNMVAAIVLIFLSAFSVCSAESVDLTGDWKGKNVTFEVSKESDLYKVVSHNPSGIFNGTYVGKYQDGAIKVGVPMCGDITYSKEADKLYFCGEELSRLKHKYPDVEIDKLIVDCDGVSDELCMIWTCGRDSDMEKDTVTFKVCMNRHGYHWNGSKWQKYKAETR